MASRAAPVTSKTKLSLVPPPNFSYFEETVCRCSLPVTKTNIPYLHSISIGCVVNLSKKDLDSALISYCGEQGVHIVRKFGLYS